MNSVSVQQQPLLHIDINSFDVGAGNPNMASSFILNYTLLINSPWLIKDYCYFYSEGEGHKSHTCLSSTISMAGAHVHVQVYYAQIWESRGGGTLSKDA